MLGLFGKMIGFLVRDWGKLRMSDILQFLTVGDVMDIADPSTRLKFRNFLLPEQTIDGKAKTRRIEFDMEMPEEGTEEDFMKTSAAISKRQREMGDKVQILKVNPGLFRKLKFKIMVSPDFLLPKSDAMRKAEKLEQYALAIVNPLTKKDAVTRDLLFGAFDETKDDPDKYIGEMEAPEGAMFPTEQGQAQKPMQKMLSNELQQVV